MLQNFNEEKPSETQLEASFRAYSRKDNGHDKSTRSLPFRSRCTLRARNGGSLRCCCVDDCVSSRALSPSVSLSLFLFFSVSFPMESREGGARVDPRVRQHVKTSRVCADPLRVCLNRPLSRGTSSSQSVRCGFCVAPDNHRPLICFVNRACIINSLILIEYF